MEMRFHVGRAALGLLACHLSAALGLLTGSPSATTFAMINSRLTRSRIAMAAIAANQRAAEEQKAEYFAMLPWEVPTKLDLPFGLKSNLDLRAFVQPFNRSGAVMTGVWVAQEGIGNAYPQPRKNAKVGWRAVGLVSAPDEASLPTAVARQRELIIAWANEYIRASMRTEPPVHSLSFSAAAVGVAALRHAD